MQRLIKFTSLYLRLDPQFDDMTVEEVEHHSPLCKDFNEQLMCYRQEAAMAMQQESDPERLYEEEGCEEMP